MSERVGRQPFSQMRGSNLVTNDQLPFLCLWGLREGVFPGVSLLSRRR